MKARDLRPRDRWLSLGLAGLAGLTMWAAFPPVGSGLAAVVSVTLFTLAAYRTRAGWGALLGLVAGLPGYVLMLEWLRVVGTDAWLLLAVFCTAWLVGLGWATSLVTRLPGWPLLVASCWVLQEALRNRYPFGGFGWFRLAFAQADTPFGLTIPWVSMAGVSFLVGLAGALLAGVVVATVARRWTTAAVSAAAAVVLGCVGLVLPVTIDSAAKTARIAVVQGGTPAFGLDAMAIRRAVLDNHAEQTQRFARGMAASAGNQPAFVVWPENSTDIDPLADATAAKEISDAAAVIGVPILVGAVVDVPGQPTNMWNMAIVWDPVTGPGERYAKRHLVPFGEFVPLRSLIGSLAGRLDQVSRDFIPGQAPGLLVISGIRVGDLICYEVIADWVVQDVINAGAQVITVQTNNATYGGTVQPDQQLQIERLRAREFDRMTLVASTTGISAVIDEQGSVISSLGQGAAGVLDEQVELRTHRTPAAKYGGVIEWGVSGIAVVGILAALVPWSRLRPKSGVPPSRRRVGA